MTSFTSSSADSSRYSVCFWNKYLRFGPLGALISWSNNRKVGARVGGFQPESPRRATKAQRWAGRLKQQTHSEASEVHEQWKYFVHVEAGFMDGPGERWASGCSSVDYRLPEYSLLLWKTKPTFNSLLTSSEEVLQPAQLLLTVYYNSTIVMTGRWWIWEVMNDLIGFPGTLFTLFTHTFILQFAVFWYEASSSVQTKRLYLPPLLLSTTTLTAAPRGNHSEIIIGIQFGFVNVDRALLHWDTRVRLKWSSAFSCSVASLSSKLLSSASADRRASHSLLKGLFFFFARFLSEEKSTALCPWPNLLAPSLGLGWRISSLYSRSMRLGPCDSTSMSEIVQTRVNQPTGPPGIRKLWNLYVSNRENPVFLPLCLISIMLV